MTSRGGYTSCSTRGAPKDALEGRLVVHETRNVADKGECMSYCVCVVSIVRTSYADLKEECLDKIKYVSAPAYRHKLKMANPQVWRQTQSKECSLHWLRHNPDDDQDAFGLSLRPRSGRMQWADTKHDEAARNQRATSLSDKELHWNLANKPRVKLEVFAVGTPSKPEERFLGQAYLGWHEICARLRVDESRQGPPTSSKIYLQVKPRSFKSRVKGYFVVSLEPAKRAPPTLPLVKAPGAATIAPDPNQGGRETRKRAAGTNPTAMAASGIPRSGVSTYYSRNTVLFCQVVRVENLQSPSPSIDPYVLLETQPSRSQYSRRARTPTKFNAATADFKDAFIFDGLRPEIQDISVSVWNENTTVRHNCLGHIVIPLEAIFHNMRNHRCTATGICGETEDVERAARDTTMVFELTQHNGADGAHKGDGLALVHLSLWFCSAKEAMAACRLLTPTGLPGNVSSAVFFEPELRKVHVDVIKARGLPPKVKKNGCVAGRDSYCTIALTGCAQKNSTQVHRSTLWPDFNERFAFLVAQNQLHRITCWGAGQGGPGEGGEGMGEEGGLPRLAMADCSSEDTAREAGSQSHRAEGAAINNQPVLEVCKRLGAPILTIKVFDYEPVHQSLGGGDRLIGKLKVPVSHLPTNSAKSCVKPQWVPLVGGSNIRGRQFMTNTPPELCVRACFEEEDKLPGKVRAPIGNVSITLKKVYLESSAADIASERGGLYCVVKYGKELVKTPCHQAKRSKSGVRKKSTSAQQSKRTARDTDRSEYNEYNSIATYRSTPQCTDRSEDHDVFMSDLDSLKMRDLRVFKFGDRCIFAVTEPSSVIAVGIFDVADIKLSKIQMRLSTFLRPSNRMLYPISIEIPDKGESRHVGYLEFSLTINYNSKLDLWRRYFTLTQPPLDYTNPLPLKTQYNVQLQEQDILRGSLLQGSNKLHSDVVKVMLGTESIKFSIPCVQKRFANITESLRNLVPVDLTKIQVYNPATWDKPWLSAVIISAICVAIQFAQYLLPLTFLVLVVAGLCLRKFQREIILYELSRLSRSQEEAEEGSQSGQGKAEDGGQDFMSGLKLDSALVLDDSSVLQREDEDNPGNFHIPDFESNTFNVDCFWQDTGRGMGDGEEGEWEEEEEEEEEALSHTTSGRSETKKKKKLIKVKRTIEIIKLSVEDKLLTIKTKAGTKIKVVKVKMADRVDGVKLKLEDRLKHINAALKSKFPHLRVKLRDLQSANRTLRHNVKHKASKVKTKVGHAVTEVKNRAESVLSKAGDAIDGVRGRARKEIESSLLAVRRRAGFVVFMDKYIQLKKQYDELKSYSGITQMMLGDLNKCLQNIRGLVLWTDPRVSFFFVFSLFLVSLFLFCFGFKLTMQLALIYGLRPPVLRDPYPPLPLIPFLRMSSVEESPLWCLLGLRSISASNTSKNR